MILVDGKVTVDTTSLHILQAPAAINDVTNDDEPSVINEEQAGRHVTSASFGRKPSRLQWSKSALDLLYEVCLLLVI